MDSLSHTGKIIDLTPEFVSVEIISTSACSDCRAKELCGISDETVKIISVHTDPYANYKLGDEVDVTMKKTMGLKAVWLSYVVPLFVLMIILLTLSRFKVNELSAGLYSLLGVAFYYLIIYLFRNKLAKEFVFEIREK